MYNSSVGGERCPLFYVEDELDMQAHRAGAD